MAKENVSLDFKLQKIDEIGNYFSEEIKNNDFMSEKHTKMCRVLNYFKLILKSKLLQTFSSFGFCCQWMCFNFNFCFISWCSYRYWSSAEELKICAITTGIKKYKSIIKKKR